MMVALLIDVAKNMFQAQKFLVQHIVWTQIITIRVNVVPNIEYFFITSVKPSIIVLFKLYPRTDTSKTHLHTSQR